MSGNYESMEEYICDSVSKGYNSADGEPLKCCKCDSEDFHDEVVDTIEGTTCSKYRKCSKCNNFMGEWSYGNWCW